MSRGRRRGETLKDAAREEEGSMGTVGGPRILTPSDARPPGGLEPRGTCCDTSKVEEGLRGPRWGQGAPGSLVPAPSCAGKKPWQGAGRGDGGQH